MPKIAREMSALQVSRLTEEGDHHVGGVQGLLLRIAGNSKVWVLRARVGDKRRNIGLGTFQNVSLAQAREAARAKRAEIAAGSVENLTRRDARKAAAVAAQPKILFRQASKEAINAKRPEWKNAKHAEQWTNTLEAYAYPVIGDLDVPEITVRHIMEVLEPIWLTKTETASRVRGRIESVIDYANVKYELGIENPARWKGNLDVLLPDRSKVAPVEHHEAVPWKIAPAAASVIRRRAAIAAKALQAVILSACRVSEVLGMRKGEVLVAERLWIVPAERMKWPRDHYVPLSDQLLQLLVEAGLDGDPKELVFSSSQKRRKGQELATDALRQVMRKNKVDGTPHGWRSTFKDWASEATQYPNELSEMALAHTIENKAEAAYRRGDMLDRRRPMMQDWADYVTGKKKPA